MLKENWRLISRIERCGDVAIVLFSFLAAYYGRNSLYQWATWFDLPVPFSGEVLAPIRDYFSLLVVAVLGYLGSLQVLGGYTSMRLTSSWKLLWVSVLSSIFVFLLQSATIFLLKLDLSRSFVIIFCVLVTLLLAAERYLVLGVLRYWRRRGMNFRNVLICGTGIQSLRLAAEIATRKELGIRVRGFVDLSGSLKRGGEELGDFKRALLKHAKIRTSRVIAGLDGLERAMRDYAIDEVIFADISRLMGEVEEGVRICADQGVETTIAAELFSTGVRHSRLSYFGGMPLIHFQAPPGDTWKLNVKRVLDFSVSAALLVVLSPLLFLLSLLVKTSSRGPVIFVQRRVGRNGRLFNMYKFRSMFDGAEEKLASLQEKNEMKGPVFKMKRDPRVTRVGRLMRKFSLDELPQLWNVLIGDMSLVGPRPPVPGEVSLYNRRDRRRLSMRPGITCIWQVEGRNQIPDFATWVEMDLSYIDNWSLGKDMKILAKTIPAVLSGTGAS